MKRIVKEILKNGDIQYRVETNRCFFGLIPCDWYTCSVYLGTVDCSVNAVFSSLNEAKIFAGIDPNPVINKEVLEYNNTSAGHVSED